LLCFWIFKTSNQNLINCHLKFYCKEHNLMMFLVEIAKTLHATCQKPLGVIYVHWNHVKNISCQGKNRGKKIWIPLEFWIDYHFLPWWNSSQVGCRLFISVFLLSFLLFLSLIFYWLFLLIGGKMHRPPRCLCCHCWGVIQNMVGTWKQDRWYYNHYCSH
jgi:hypothetical protein